MVVQIMDFLFDRNDSHLPEEKWLLLTEVAFCLHRFLYIGIGDLTRPALYIYKHMGNG